MYTASQTFRWLAASLALALAVVLGPGLALAEYSYPQPEPYVHREYGHGQPKPYEHRDYGHGTPAGEQSQPSQGYQQQSTYDDLTATPPSTSSVGATDVTGGFAPTPADPYGTGPTSGLPGVYGLDATGTPATWRDVPINLIPTLPPGMGPQITAGQAWDATATGAGWVRDHGYVGGEVSLGPGLEVDKTGAALNLVNVGMQLSGSPDGSTKLEVSGDIGLMAEGGAEVIKLNGGLTMRGQKSIELAADGSWSTANQAGVRYWQGVNAGVPFASGGYTREMSLLGGTKMQVKKDADLDALDWALLGAPGATQQGWLQPVAEGLVAMRNEDVGLHFTLDFGRKHSIQAQGEVEGHYGLVGAKGYAGVKPFETKEPWAIHYTSPDLSTPQGRDEFAEQIRNGHFIKLGLNSGYEYIKWKTGIDPVAAYDKIKAAGAWASQQAGRLYEAGKGVYYKGKHLYDQGKLYVAAGRDIAIKAGVKARDWTVTQLQRKLYPTVQALGAQGVRIAQQAGGKALEYGQTALDCAQRGMETAKAVGNRAWDLIETELPKLGNLFSRRYGPPLPVAA